MKKMFKYLLIALVSFIALESPAPGPIAVRRVLLQPKNQVDPDALAYFNQLSPKPSNNFTTAVNAFVIQLKKDGNWDLLTRFWILAAEYQQNARVSLVNPTSTNISEVNSPNWVAGQGYTSNGTSSYLNTNFNTLSGASNFTTNSNCLGIYSNTNQQSTGIDIGNQNGTVINYIVTRYTDDKQYHRSNVTSAGFASASNTNSQGLFCSVRTNSTTIYGYKNGSAVCTSTNTSGTHPNLNIFICATNSSGSPGSYTTRQYSFAFIGNGSIDQLKLYNAISTLKNALSI